MIGSFDGYPDDDYDDDGDFVGRTCYVFNPQLPKDQNDTMCIHCRKFMTLDCEHIGDFIDGDE